MGRRRAHVPLNVFMNARFVGRLERNASGAVSFQYDSVWLSWEHAIPLSLSLPLREQSFQGAAVFPVIDNLLPDGEFLRQRIAERIRAEGSDAYSLLTKVGRDCVGALQFLPHGEDPGPAGLVDGQPMDEAGIARMIRNLARSPLGLDPAEPDFRISIAGAHEKTALLRLDGKWCLPRGATATTHILKPPIGIVNDGLDLRLSCENEWLSLRICKSFGLPTAEAWIEDFEDLKVLVVERFDRVWSGDRLLRHPQEDFCQATSTPPGRKYQSDGGPGMVTILGLLKASDAPHEDQRTFLKAQMMFWLMAAIDGHAKNFGIRLFPGGGFRLAPLYDVLSAWPAVQAEQIPYRKAKLAMAVGRNRHYHLHEICADHFEQTCILARIPPTLAREISDEIADTAERSMDAALSSLPPGFPDALATTIREKFLNQVLVKAAG